MASVFAAFFHCALSHINIISDCLAGTIELWIVLPKLNSWLTPTSLTYFRSSGFTMYIFTSLVIMFFFPLIKLHFAINCNLQRSGRESIVSVNPLSIFSNVNVLCNYGKPRKTKKWMIICYC